MKRGKKKAEAPHLPGLTGSDPQEKLTKRNILVFFVATVVVAIGYHLVLEHFKDVDAMTGVHQVIPRLERKFGSLKGSLDIFSSEHEKELLWGTYRPHLYFGMRTRTGVDSVVVGLMWFKTDLIMRTGVDSVVVGLMWFKTGPRAKSILHTAKSENQVKFSWVHHDGRNYGKQVIIDNEYEISLTIRFYKDERGDWGVRVSSEDLIDRGEPSKISIMFYVGIANKEKGKIGLIGAKKKESIQGPNIWKGFTPKTGKFEMSLLDNVPYELNTTFGIPNCLLLCFGVILFQNPCLVQYSKRYAESVEVLIESKELGMSLE